MLQVKTVKLKIVKNNKTSFCKVVPTYEAEVIKAIFGEENVEVMKDPTQPRVIESIDEELERLSDAYLVKHIAQLHGVNYAEKLRAAINKVKSTANATKSAE